MFRYPARVKRSYTRESLRASLWGVKLNWFSHERKSDPAHCHRI